MRFRKLGKRLRPKQPAVAVPVLEQDEPTPFTVWEFEAIGTQWWIGIYDDLEQSELDALSTAVRGRIERFDHMYSRFREDSMISTMAKQAGAYAIPARGRDMLLLYRELYDATGGAMTPLIGNLLSDAGYDANYSLQPKPVLSNVPTWDSTLMYDSGVLTLKKPALLDFGALGKGCLVDMVGRLLYGAGVSSYCIDAGGDMLYRGRQPMHIGLEDPDDTSQVIGIATLGNPLKTGRQAAAQPNWLALCGSAGNRRAWGEVNHIMHPRSKSSPQHIKAVWVAADSTMLADGLTTALYFATPQKLMRRFDFAWLIIDADGRVRHSPDFPATLFTTA